MRNNVIDAGYVTAAAAALDLPLPPGHLDAVVEQLRRIEQAAAPMLARALDAGDEMLPLWRP